MDENAIVAYHDQQDPTAYLQSLLDRAHEELAEYKRGLAQEIRYPLLMELVALAQTVEAFLHQKEEILSTKSYRDFLESGLLSDIRQALSRHGVEPFICSSEVINRRVQRVVQVEETDDANLAGRVQPFTRGYADHERVLQKEQVVLFKPRET